MGGGGELNEKCQKKTKIKGRKNLKQMNEKKKKQRKARLNIRQGNFGQTHPEILFHYSL